MRKSFLLIAFLLVLSEVSRAEVCVFQDGSGQIFQTNSKSEIPAKYKKTSKRADSVKELRSDYLAAPEEIELEGNVRREKISSPLGPIELRWPRKIEGLFGQTPLRATTEAAKAVSRVLRKASFPSELQNLDTELSIIFLDENLPETQIPQYLISNCHPGWMTPPGNIYIVGQRIAAGCGGQQMSPRNADAKMAEVLVHELGHVVEFNLLNRTLTTPSRPRSEGFATWFEHLAAFETPLIDATALNKERLAMATYAIKKSPGVFTFTQGDSLDYSRASLYFSTIEDRKGVRGVVEIYEIIVKQKVSFEEAVEIYLGWDSSRLEEEAAKYLERKS